MKCLNVHIHPLDIYVWKNKKFQKKLNLNINSFTNSINKNSSDLYAIICTQCNEIYNEYESNYNLVFNDDNSESNVSLFCTKSSIKNFKLPENIYLFEYYEFSDYILIGTKNEIISFISREFNSLEYNYTKLKKEMYSTNEKNENSMDRMKRDLNKEKTEKQKMENELINIKEQKDTLSNDLKKKKH